MNLSPGLAASVRVAGFLVICEAVRRGVLIADRRFWQCAAGARYAACVIL